MLSDEQEHEDAALFRYCERVEGVKELYETQIRRPLHDELLNGFEVRVIFASNE